MGRSRSGTRRSYHSNPTGVLSVYADGYGFVRTSEGEFFIPEKKMGGAFDGDVVEVAPLPKRGSGKEGRVPSGTVAAQSPAARVVRVLDRAHDVLVGRYEVAEPFGVVVPLDYRMRHDIFTMRSENPDIPDGALVRVRIASFPTRNAAATGHIEAVLSEGEERVCAIDSIIERHSLETKFSVETLRLAGMAQVDADQALRSGYHDIRDRMTFTIDPDDAKDYDDALSIAPAGGEVAKGREGAGGAKIAWRLGVHIADVAQYVPWDCAIDLDARRRATSFYLVDRVLPMLPEALSNEICSLKPHQDRRCMTVDLYLDASAEVVGVDIYPALMNSRARLTYSQVQDVLEHSAGQPVEDSTACSTFEECYRVLTHIAQLRRERRRKQGAPSFRDVEAKVKLSSTGDPIGVELHEKTLATELVEEAMLMANEAVAHYLLENDIPGLYRVHEAPLPANVAALVPIFAEYPWFSQVDEERLCVGDTFQIQKVLELSRGRAEEDTVSALLLRAMKRAVYSPSCDGHFGLAAEEYLHFTSPIRRYPDLVVHRILKAHLEKKRLGALSAEAKKAVSAETSQLAWMAEHSSKMERLAEDVSRETQEYMLVEYMQQFLGQRFSATVSGVVSYGIYVRLDNTTEGLIRLSELGDDYFMLDGLRHTLTGEETGARFALGQRVVVTLRSADPQTRTLGFSLCGTGVEKGKVQ